jgi:uncharacterized protein (TIRG00374 family)
MAFSVFLMVILYRKVNLTQLKSVIMEMNPAFVAMAILLTFANYFWRAIRWRYLLLPIKKAKVSNLFSSTIIGYMANSILPARLGEFVRAYVLAKKERTAAAPVFATLVIDRLCEGFTIMLTLAAVLIFLNFPPEMQGTLTAIRTGGGTIFLTYLAVIAFLVILRLQTAHTLKIVEALLKFFPQSFSEKIISLLCSFITGIRISTNGHHLVAIVMSTMLIWVLTIMPIDLILCSAGINLPFSVSMFTMVLIVFAALIPSSPGSIGTFHFACYKGLTAFNVLENKALGIAMVLHAIWFFPVIFAGLYYLWKDRISLKTIQNKAINIT